MQQEDPEHKTNEAINALRDHTAAIENIVSHSIPNYRSFFAVKAWTRMAARSLVALLFIVAGSVSMCLLSTLISTIAKSLLTDASTLRELAGVISLLILPLSAIILTCIWAVVRMVSHEE